MAFCSKQAHTNCAQQTGNHASNMQMVQRQFMRVAVNVLQTAGIFSLLQQVRVLPNVHQMHVHKSCCNTGTDAAINVARSF
jgi:hypothetical protein